MSTPLLIAFIALWVVVLAEAVLLAVLFRHFGLQAVASHHGVELAAVDVGKPAPALRALDQSGRELTWRPPEGRLQFMLFVAANCGPCLEVLPSVDRLAASAAREGLPLDFTIVVAGGAAGLESLLEHQSFEALQPIAEAPGANDVSDAYGVQATPFAVVVGGHGRVVAKGLSSDLQRVRDLAHKGAIATREPSVAQFLDSDPDLSATLKVEPYRPVAATRL